MRVFGQPWGLAMEDREPLLVRRERHDSGRRYVLVRWILFLMAGALPVLVWGAAAYPSDDAPWIVLGLLLAVVAAGLVFWHAGMRRTTRGGFAAATSQLSIANRCGLVVHETRPATIEALGDVALATGTRGLVVPWQTDSRATDALVITDGRQARVIVTTGLMDSFTPAAQRAVFAFCTATLLHAHAFAPSTALSPNPRTIDLWALEILHEPHSLIEALLAAAESEPFKWNTDRIPQGALCVRWGDPRTCLSRATHLAEVSGAEGAASLRDGLRASVMRGCRQGASG